MNDEQKQPLLEAWFSDREVAPENVEEGVTRVMTEVPQTRQHGRWLPLPLHRPKATSTTPTATDTTEYQPRPISASNGHTPTVIGRTQSMLSPAKAITAGALVFAIGGVLLIAQPFDQQGGNVPGAAEDGPLWPNRETAVIFTGQITAGSADEIEWTSSSAGGQEYRKGQEDVFEVIYEEATWLAVSDPRLDGSITIATRLVDVGPTQDNDISGHAYRIVNDDGAWIGRPSSFFWLSEDEVAPASRFHVLDGQGAYAGLTAMWTETGHIEEGVEHDPLDVKGIIFEGPAPEPIAFDELAARGYGEAPRNASTE